MHMLGNLQFLFVLTSGHEALSQLYPGALPLSRQHLQITIKLCLNPKKCTHILAWSNFLQGSSLVLWPQLHFCKCSRTLVGQTSGSKFFFNSICLWEFITSTYQNKHNIAVVCWFISLSWPELDWYCLFMIPFQYLQWGIYILWYQ